MLDIMYLKFNMITFFLIIISYLAVVILGGDPSYFPKKEENGIANKPI